MTFWLFYTVDLANTFIIPSFLGREGGRSLILRKEYGFLLSLES